METGALYEDDVPWTRRLYFAAIKNNGQNNYYTIVMLQKGH